MTTYTIYVVQFYSTRPKRWTDYQSFRELARAKDSLVFVKSYSSGISFRLIKRACKEVIL